jgi:hypothetical protein
VYSTDDSHAVKIEERSSYIKQYVHELLLSKDAKRVCLLQYKRAKDKYHQECARRWKAFQLKAVNFSWIDVVQLGIILYQTVPFDEKFRYSIAQTCCDILQRVICIVTTHFDLRIKDSELRVFVFGLMFLMRSGVCMQGVSILPRIKELETILPSEALMTEFRFFKAKHITDTENRFKFIFRHQTQARLKNFFSGDERLNRHEKWQNEI